jgi:hypothetical protein
MVVIRAGATMRVALALVGLVATATCRSGPSGSESGSDAPRPRPELRTEAERSDWRKTGRYEEAVRLCGDFAAAFPAKVRCAQLGVTAELRPIVALVASADGTLTPEAAAARQRPVVLVQGGIHAGEIEGKDAGFWLLRELLEGGAVAGALDAVTLVFVPVINPDGHERFGPTNRPNQRGPEESGFRTNAANLNLNRDHMKVDAPEMAALLGLWRQWDPVIYVDLHATDGAKFEHDVAVMVSPQTPREDRLDELARALSGAVQARLAEAGHLPLAFYPSFVTYDDPSSGFSDDESPPRFSSGYAAARGRLGVLVETHSWRTYSERVRATRDVLEALLARAVTDGAAWRAAAAETDAADARLAGREVVLLHGTAAAGREIEFRGYHYERRPSEVSGGTWTIYDEARPEIWRVPLRDTPVPAVTVTAPRAGYVVQAGFAAAVAARLDHHAIGYVRLGDGVAALDAEVFRATAVTHEPSFEGRTRVRLSGSWTAERRAIAPGSLWVPIDQPRARLILHLLEPTAPDSLAAWGFFNAVFERKEYMEGYVAEEVARQMLEDPAVRAAFELALEDATFAADPQRRLEFFYRRHPAWDERKDLLPVLRLAAAPPARGEGVGAAVREPDSTASASP